MSDDGIPEHCQEDPTQPECSEYIIRGGGSFFSDVIDDGPVAALAAAVGVSASVVVDTFQFMEEFLDDPLGFITGPATEFVVDQSFALYEWVFAFMLSIADLLINIGRQSVYDPISQIWLVVTWPLVAFIDGYYALALSSAEAAGPFAPVVVIAFFLALMVIVYAIGVTISTALSVFIGVRLDQLALSLWHRLNRVTGRVMPLPDRLSGGDDG